MAHATTRTGLLALAIAVVAGILALSPFAAAPAAANGPTNIPPVTLNPSRPDLVIIQHPDNHPGGLDAVIINRGNVPAGVFKVRFDGGETTKFIRIDGLAPGQRVNVYLDFIDAPCRLYTITVDPSNAVNETNESNNVISEFVCAPGHDLD